METVVDTTEEVVEETEEISETQETPEETPETTEEPTKPSEDYSKKVQARIDKLTREKYEARQKAEQYEARLKEYEANKAERPARPNVKGFQDEYGDVDYDKYNEAMASYEDRLFSWRESQRESQNVEIKTKAETEAKLENYQAAAEISRAKYPDYEEVTNRPVYTPELREVLLENRMAEIAYHLGKNSTEAIRIGNLPIANMMLELGRFEERLNSGKKSSSATPPIKPVETDTGLVDSELSDEEWIKRDLQKQHQKLKQR